MPSAFDGLVGSGRFVGIVFVWWQVLPSTFATIVLSKSSWQDDSIDFVLEFAKNQVFIVGFG